MNRLIYYTYSMPPGGMTAADEWRLLNSITSLRAHNRTIPVRLFTFARLPEPLAARLSAHDVGIELIGDYACHLRDFCSPATSEALSRFPLLHKWTCLARLATADVEQILYVDADTHFFRDVAACFERYRECALYAREEPFSRRSPLGPRPAHLDEEALDALVRDLGLAPIAPFNTGLILFNQGAWRAVAERLREFVDYVWRFTLWLVDRPEPGDTVDLVYLREQRQRLVPPEELPRALPYPSHNRWLREEIAIWLALGGAPGLRCGGLERADVWQGGEFATEAVGHRVAAHYFSANTEAFRSWLVHPAAEPAAESAHADTPASMSRAPLHPVAGFFQTLGERIESAWRARRYDEECFPEIAEQALTELPPCEHLGTYDTVTWMLTAPELPPQLYLDVAFGQPAVQVYVTPRWHIEVLHWVDGTTSIHEHGFNGAFHVLAGSSIHCRYRFHEEERYNARLRQGRVERIAVELLRRGQTRRILAGQAMSHSLFHLDRPSVTVVVRTRQVPGASPQFAYLPPCLALDPFHQPEHLVRQKQGLAMLVEVAHPDLEPLLARAYREADPLAFVQLALSTADAFHTPDARQRALETTRARHGGLVDALDAILTEQDRQRRIIRLRSRLHHPEHRFLLALLLHFDEVSPILQLIRDYRPERPAEDTLLEWMKEITQLSDPQEPTRKVFPFALDGGALDVARLMLGGRPLAEVLQLLGEQYDAADIAAQASELALLHEGLRASPIFGSLFRGPLSRGAWGTVNSQERRGTACETVPSMKPGD
jgi:hypothetical protein